MAQRSADAGEAKVCAQTRPAAGHGLRRHGDVGDPSRPPAEDVAAATARTGAAHAVARPDAERLLLRAGAEDQADRPLRGEDDLHAAGRALVARLQAVA